jgi:hypothetical protein
LAQLLEPIQRYCVTHDQPPLTVLVVKIGSGMPGKGFTAVPDFDLRPQDVPIAQEKVYGHEWPPAPTPEQFA